jgi:hypothetical protein
VASVNLDPAKDAIILERPLFSPSRRKPQAVPPPSQPGAGQSATGTTKPAEPEAPPLDFALVGIVQDGDTRLAVLQPQDGQANQILREGQALQDWTLTAVEADRASFRNAGFSRQLILDFRRAAPTKP